VKYLKLITIKIAASDLMNHAVESERIKTTNNNLHTGHKLYPEGGEGEYHQFQRRTQNLESGSLSSD
jgi:hypothetical protein